MRMIRTKRRALIATVLALGIGSQAAVAGPVGTAIPVNPCPPANNGTLKLALVANEVDVGSGYAGTMVVCYHVGKSATAPMDVVVETFDNLGVPLGTASNCGVVSSASTSFLATSYAAPMPYTGTAIAPYGPTTERGSLRILSTNPSKVACDVTLFDTWTFLGAPALLWTKDVTVTKAATAQKGD